MGFKNEEHKTPLFLFAIFKNRFTTTNSRSFVIRAEGGDIPEAAKIANGAIEQIFSGQLGKGMLDYRPDIGTSERIKVQMEKLKSIWI